VLLHGQYDILDGIAIAARGPVASVFLAHREPIEKLKRIAVDPASRTSVWLLRVLLKIGYHIEPEFYLRPSGAKLSEHEAMMLIGDDAIWYVTRNGAPPVWDLGEAWMDLTGLPFVFAVWAAQREVCGSALLRANEPVAPGRALLQLLRTAKASGLAHIEQIVQDATEATPEFLRDYYSKCVWYHLDSPEKKGLTRFQQYVKELGLVEKTHDLRYVS
jgi:chorismate dehydratase